MGWKGWDGVTEDMLGKNRTAAPAADAGGQSAPGVGLRASHKGAAARGDRGTRRGAKRVIVTPDGQIVEHALAKASGLTGIFFQSRREAVQWVAHTEYQARGQITQLRRQVKFPLQTKNAQGLTETITHYTADIVFVDLAGKTHVLDVKPRNGLREDVYLLKKKWFEAQYGLPIEEVH